MVRLVSTGSEFSEVKCFRRDYAHRGNPCYNFSKQLVKKVIIHYTYIGIRDDRFE